LVTGITSWKNLSKEEIIEKYLSDKTPETFRASYGEYIDDVTEMDDIISYALYSIILENLDSYSWHNNHNISEYEFECLTRGYSSDIIELIRKAEPYLKDMGVSDDNDSASRFAQKYKNNEDGFWNFVYTVAEITEH
jgi:hypothetical protein